METRMNSFVVISLSALVFWGCGQNPSLTKDASNKRASALSAEGSAESSETSEVETAEVILSGPPGPSGRDGQDGRDACGIRPVTAEYVARPFTLIERAETTLLPYVSTSQHAVETLPMGRASRYAGNVPYVANSQVLFAVDVAGLPPRTSITDVIQASLKVSVTKLSRDSYTSTELLCFVDERICSGELFVHPEWLDNVNEPFFSSGDGLVNGFFSSRFLNKDVGRVGSNALYGGDLTLPLDELLSGSSLQPLDLIYGGTPEGQALDQRTLKMVIADDTYVSSASLVVTLREDQCRTLELQEVE